jgi:glycosyltransferase involved in cell wall biosynthesis
MTQADLLSNIWVSVIIPTFNRARVLPDVLVSLGRQTLNASRFEVIIVDNCSTDGTESLVRQWAEKTPIELIFHCMPENRGPVRSRNTAAGMARGPILALTDSDCRVSDQWLENGLKALAEDERIAFVTGPILDKPEQRGGLFSLRYQLPSSEDPTYRTANVFYRREIFRKMGGFDENAYFGQTYFMHYECADIDLAWRIKKDGYPNRFVPELVVYHEVWRVSPWNWLHKQTQMLPLPFFLKRHPDLSDRFLWRWPFCFMQNCLFYLMVLGILLGATVSKWFLVLVLPYLVWLLRLLKFSDVIQRPIRSVAQLVTLSIGQAVTCASLIYGSFRARKIVL